MPNFNPHAILSRVIAVILICIVVGLVGNLVVAILKPVLPKQVTQDMGSGFDMLYGFISPAMTPIMAILILLALCWIFLGRRR